MVNLEEILLAFHDKDYLVHPIPSDQLFRNPNAHKTLPLEDSAHLPQAHLPDAFQTTTN